MTNPVGQPLDKKGKPLNVNGLWALVFGNGESRRAIDQACALLLAAAGRGASDAEAVCRHAAEDRGAAVASGIAARGVSGHH